MHISESDDESPACTPPPRERPTRARAAQPKSYKLDAYDEDSDDEPVPKKKKITDESDEDLYHDG